MKLILGMISIESIVWVIFEIIIGGLIYWLLTWALGAIGLPEPAAKVARVILILGLVFFLICILLGLIGHPIIRI